LAKLSKNKHEKFYLKKRMDMGKCTSCILYIKQNPTTYKETTISQRNSTLIAAVLLESSTTNQYSFFQVNNISRTFHEYRNKV
jgi:hypothetical protein